MMGFKALLAARRALMQAHDTTHDTMSKNVVRSAAKLLIRRGHALFVKVKSARVRLFFFPF